MCLANNIYRFMHFATELITAFILSAEHVSCKSWHSCTEHGTNDIEPISKA